MRNTLFDEKIDGTVHLALGGGYTFIGGTNESAIHWDMVKDSAAAASSGPTAERCSTTARWLICLA